MLDPILRKALHGLNFTFEATENVQARAESYVQQIELLVTSRNRLGANVRSVICLHLACKSLGLIFPHKTAIALSGIAEVKYNTAFKELAQMLHLESKITISELVVQFGCPYLLPQAEKVYREFVINFAHSNKALKARINPNSSVAIAACFYATCQFSKVKVDTNKLLAAHITYPKEFKFVVEIVHSICKTSLVSQNQLVPESKEDNLQPDAKPPGSTKIQFVSPFAGYSMLPFQHLERTRAYLDYLNWKASILKDGKPYSTS